MLLLKALIVWMGIWIMVLIALVLVALVIVECVTVYKSIKQHRKISAVFEDILLWLVVFVLCSLYLAFVAIALKTYLLK